MQLVTARFVKLIASRSLNSHLELQFAALDDEALQIWFDFAFHSFATNQVKH
jgi:hypothetical protein